ncbi:MAG: Unknown protein [uncultured Campylobacterales bacterium]|uniref:Thiamine biosynthesis protein ThiS n=1 Tax=uncultured Campylobacterales bacterium TaxID=352960 RepID=A0A6S6S9J6_9BACT|nr:MAG: Unknown protein [uncultured Campylobacterales bacterium]
MLVTINGQEQNIEDNITVEKLLQELKIYDKTMAAAIDMKIVKKKDWSSRTISQNDKIEFLNFVGGG